MIRIICLFIFLGSFSAGAQQRNTWRGLRGDPDRMHRPACLLRSDGPAFRQTFAPFITFDSTPGRSRGYWQGMVLTRTSPDKSFASTYYYDMQGNLRETRSFFNIRRRGQLTNWKIQIPSQYRSPVLVRTF